MRLEQSSAQIRETERASRSDGRRARIADQTFGLLSASSGQISAGHECRRTNSEPWLSGTDAIRAEKETRARRRCGYTPGGPKHY